MDLCFATNNPNKIREVKAALGPGYNLLSLNDIGCDEELKEDGATLEENSGQKAWYVFRNYKVNCFADDTGLEVFALNGEPGVYSARYAGRHKSNDDNMQLLLERLKPHSNRQAQFRTVVTLIIDGSEYLFEGVVKGVIIDEKRGEKGFGYDPVFVPEGFDRTFAEMTLREKGRISHRGKAIQKLIDFLNSTKADFD